MKPCKPIAHPTYTYRGDRLTDVAMRGASCTAVRRADGRCVRGRNGSMLVRFSDGTVAVVLGRQLRKDVRFSTGDRRS